MLKIKGNSGKLRYVLRDEDEEPQDVDDLILREAVERERRAKEKTEKDDAGTN